MCTYRRSLRRCAPRYALHQASPARIGGVRIECSPAQMAVQSPASASGSCRLTEIPLSRPKNPKIGWDIFRSFTLFTHGGYDNEPFPTSLHPSARQTCPSPYSPPQYLCPPSRVPASRAIAASSAAPPRKEVSSDADLSAPIDSPSKSCHFLQLPLFAIPVRDAPSRSPGIGIRPRVWTAHRSRSSSDHTIRTFRASPLEYHP